MHSISQLDGLAKLDNRIPYPPGQQKMEWLA